MAEDTEQSSKTEAPSQRRLDEARLKGDVARSPDVPAFMALAGALGATMLLAGPLCRHMATALLPFLEHPDAIDLSGQGGVLVLRQALEAAAPAGAVMIAALVAGVLGGVAQQGILWSPQKLQPDFQKLNIVKGLGRLFGLDGFTSFLKTFAKLLAVAAVAWMILQPKAGQLAQLPRMEPVALLPLVFDWLKGLAIAVLCVLGPVAAADYLWQRHRFMTRMKMTREETKQEFKDTDGDPHIKAKRRQLRAARARSRMIQAVPTATVVVMNPTHYAVALRYVPGEDAAPLCVAKGVDSLALKIREIAEAAGVTVVEDPPLARTLHAALEVDQTIPQAHYQAVAKLIGFVFSTARGKRASAAAVAAAKARAEGARATARPAPSAPV